MNDPEAKLSDRLEASELLADRGWGKPAALLALEDDHPSLDPERLTVEQIDREIARLLTELAEAGVNAVLT
jgi:hypothetical protein